MCVLHTNEKCVKTIEKQSKSHYVKCKLWLYVHLSAFIVCTSMLYILISHYKLMLATFMRKKYNKY